MIRTYLNGIAAVGLVALLVAPGPALAQGAGGYLGVTIEEVGDEEVERLDLPEERGALVRGVVDGSPAAEAGLAEDDVVVAWNDESVESAAELSRLVRETPPGRSVSVEVHRDGDRRRLTVEVGERSGRVGRALTAFGMSEADRAEMRERLEEVRASSEEARERVREEMRERRDEVREQRQEMRQQSQRAREARERARVHVRELRNSLGDLDISPGDASYFVFGGPARMGVRLQSLGDQLAEYFGVGERKGALVTSVREDSPAQAAGLRAGDVIVGIGDDEVDDPGDVLRAVRGAEPGSMSVSVVRDGRELSMTVELPESGEAEFGFWREGEEGGAFRFGPGEEGPWPAPPAPGTIHIEARPAPGAPSAPVRIRSRVVPELPEMPEIEIPLAPVPGPRGPLFVI
jgi:C-terminal processing protease CtpA/Prc